MSTCADVGSFIDSKTSVVHTSNVGFTSEVADYLVVHAGPGQRGGRQAYTNRTRLHDRQGLARLPPHNWSILYSILFYSRLCPSTAGNSPPPESSYFLCPLLSLSIPLPVALQCHLSNDVLVYQLILHP